MIVTESEQGTGVHLVEGRTVCILMMNIGISLHMQNHTWRYDMDNIYASDNVGWFDNEFTNLELNHLNSC